MSRIVVFVAVLRSGTIRSPQVPELVEWATAKRHNVIEKQDVTTEMGLSLGSPWAHLRSASYYAFLWSEVGMYLPSSSSNK
jgi:hypothetical protein